MGVFLVRGLGSLSGMYSPSFLCVAVADSIGNLNILYSVSTALFNF